MIETLGWIATAVFVASYFFSRPGLLRAAQMCGAALWVGYGFLIGAVPVIVANVLVLAAAAWTLGRQWRSTIRLAGAGSTAYPEPVAGQLDLEYEQAETRS